MQSKPTIHFKISHMDSLGQGVSKEENIVFIHKTLPGESGEAQITAKRKGVAFARMTKITEASADRIEPVCPHFAVCPSCHYLHTTYEKEVEFKLLSFKKIFQKLPLPPVKVLSAPRRLGYRNRIQLHYDTKKQLLGMLNLELHTIVPVPHCLIGLDPVASEIRRLYHHHTWLSEAPKNVDRGHVEIYWKDEKVQVSWNENYAQGGFSQVFQEMNELLKHQLQELSQDNPPSELLDLFGGNGNLSSALPYHKRLCVDLYPQSTEDFFSQELYLPDAKNKIKAQLKKLGMQPDFLLVDPPRSGFKELADWLEDLRPSRVAYVSCDAHTLARDMMSVQGYDIEHAFLLDFFPSTFHFETLFFLRRRA